jgi:alpha-tubulin suppressor-like RCC1 family protein
VVSGLAYAIGVKTDGTLWSWGCNTNGHLGDLSVVNKSSPVQIPGTTWCDVASGSCTVFAIKNDNTLWSWGGASNGVLGTNTTSTARSSPVQIPGTTWCDIASGFSPYALARKY